MKQLVKFKSPLHEMTQTTPTCLWNDSASLQELAYALDHGAVGATCNPVIVGEVLKKEMPLWKDRIDGLIETLPPGSRNRREGAPMTLFDGWTWLQRSKESKFERPALLNNCSPMYHAIVHRLAILLA